jgi:hypothetical protein
MKVEKAKKISLVFICDLALVHLNFLTSFFPEP